MSANFTVTNKRSGWFQSRGDLAIGELQLQGVRYHTHCIGLLRLFGKVESLSLGDETIHLNRASLIKKYRSVTPWVVNSSDTTIIHLIHCARSDHPALLISALDVCPAPGKKPQNRNLHYLDLALRPHDQTPTRPIDAMAFSLKQALRQMSGVKLHNAIQDQFKIVRLMRADGTWNDPALADNHNLLIPSEADAWEKCDQFIDQVIAAIKKNPYLLDAINHLSASQLESLRQKIEEDGMSMMKYLIPYAFALNGLTDFLAKNVALFDRINALFSKQKKPHYALKYLNLFGAIKYYTLGRLSNLTEPIKTGRISRDHCRQYLNLNIMEAVVTDRLLGNNENVKAGRTLIQHPVGGAFNPQTGSGPASIGTSRGYPVAELHPDFPKQWADLYTVWNLAFCSNADTFPLLAAKLLIPSVNDYASHPTGYLFHRVIALYLHFQFAIFRNLDGEPSFLRGWECTELTRALGTSAAASAQKYTQTT